MLDGFDEFMVELGQALGILRSVHLTENVAGTQDTANEVLVLVPELREFHSALDARAVDRELNSLDFVRGRSKLGEEFCCEITTPLYVG